MYRESCRTSRRLWPLHSSLQEAGILQEPSSDVGKGIHRRIFGFSQFRPQITPSNSVNVSHLSDRFGEIRFGQSMQHLLLKYLSHRLSKSAHVELTCVVLKDAAPRTICAGSFTNRKHLPVIPAVRTARKGRRSAFSNYLLHCVICFYCSQNLELERRPTYRSI